MVDAQSVSPLSSSLSLLLLLSEAEAGSCTDHIWREKRSRQFAGRGPGGSSAGWMEVERRGGRGGRRVALGALCRQPVLLAITGKSGALPQGQLGRGRAPELPERPPPPASV